MPFISQQDHPIFDQFHTKILDRLFLLINKYSCLSKSTYVFHSRPRFQLDIYPALPLGFNQPPELFAIIIAGPIVLRDSFTINTALLYSRLFPSSLIIISTLSSLTTKERNILQSNNVHIANPSTPVCNGPSNLNLQIATTQAGVQLAQRLGCRYLLKTRADMRIHSPRALLDIYNLIMAYPVSHPNSSISKRIIVGSHNTFRYRLYGISDTFLAGSVADLYAYFSALPDTRRSISFPSRLTHRLQSSYKIPEVYLMTSYLSRIGHDIRWTLADTFTALARYFCVIDWETLDIHWGKYTSRLRPRVNYRYPELFVEHSFYSWLAIFLGEQPSELDLHMTDELFPL